MTRTAHDGVVLRRQQLLFLAVFLSLFALLAYAASLSVDPRFPYHALQNISRTPADPASVDQDRDGRIDLAENASRADAATAVTFHLPGTFGYPNFNLSANRTALSAGCLVLDTGSGTSDTPTGWYLVNLTFARDGYDDAYHTYPALHLCADGDGCTYNVVSYTTGPSNKVPQGIYGNGNYYFMQQATSGGAIVDWVASNSGGSPTGRNGNGAQENIASSSGNWVLADDYLGSPTENDQYHFSFNDQRSDRSYWVTICD